jgi:hypothetical protein
MTLPKGYGSGEGRGSPEENKKAVSVGDLATIAGDFLLFSMQGE